MLSRYVRRLVYEAFEQLNRREFDRVLALVDDDVYFRFPGLHELAIETNSKEELRAWFDRLFTRLPSLRFDVDDVIVGGPPWDLRVCTRYRGRTESATGATSTYEGMQYLRLRWKTVLSEELFPDTQAFAAYLTGVKAA